MSWSDPTKLKRVKEFGISGIAFCVARTPGTGQLFFGNSDFKVYEVDALAEKPEPKPFEAEGHHSYVIGVVSSQQNIVSGSYDGNLIWWDSESRKPTRTIKAHERWIRRVSVSPDRTIVASIADDMIGKLWNVESGELIARDGEGEMLKGEKGPLTMKEWTASLKTTAPHLFPASESAKIRRTNTGEVDLNDIDAQMVIAAKEGDTATLRKLKAEKKLASRN